MLIDEVRNWLSVKGSYDAGMLLLAKLREQNLVDDFVWKVCTSAKTDFAYSKMQSTLQDTLDKGSLNDLQIATALPLKKSDPKAKPTPKEKKPLPEELKPVDERIKVLYAQNKVFRDKLMELCFEKTGLMADDAALKKHSGMIGEMADAIMRNDEQIRSCWNKIDLFHETGLLPDDVHKDELVKLRVWLRNILAWNNYVMKEKSYFKHHERYRNEERYKELEGELQAIKEYLDAN